MFVFYAKALKYLVQFIIIALLLVLLCACAEPKVVYKEVKIPTKCDIPKRQRPQKSHNALEYLKNILIYTELLEKDLNFCTGETKGGA